MRVYINHFNLDIINNISDIFKENLSKSETYIKLYTNEGIYRIEDKKIYSLDAFDKDIKILENYHNNLTFIVDTSFYRKHISSCIYGTSHVPLEIKKYYYKMNPYSEMQLVIKYISDTSKFIPNDIYFEFNKDVDINNLFIKKEIIEFLSVLN